MSWGIYGATGVTGGLIVAEAVRRGHHPVLIGRSASTLQPLAEAWGLPWQVAEVGDAPRLDAAVHTLSVVLNAAGPFGDTVRPILEACVRAGASYLDMSNEFDTVTDVYRAHTEAQRTGVTIVPGVGFGTVASDAVVQRALGALPAAVSVHTALLADNAPGGPATRDSVFAVLSSGSAWYQNGILRRGRLGRGVRSIATPLGRRSLVPVATGDLAAARRGTRVAELSASVALSLPSGLLRAVLPVGSAALRTGLPQRGLSRVERGIAALRPMRAMFPTRQPRERPYSSYAWARATDSRGVSVTALLSTGEGYAFSAGAAVRAVECVLEGTVPGAWTPSQAFGRDFASRVGGTSIVLVPEELATGSRGRPLHQDKRPRAQAPTGPATAAGVAGQLQPDGRADAARQS